MAEVTLEEAPRKARELFEKGFAGIERGNFEYAMDMLTGALEIEPGLLQARKFLRAAQIKKLKGKKGNQLTHLISSLQGLPTSLSAMSAVSKKPQQALKLAEKLLRIDPLNLSFVNVYKQAAVAAGLPEAAVLAMETAKDSYPKNVQLIQDLGRLYLETGQTDLAKGCFEEIVRLRPKDLKALKALKDASALDTMKSGGWTGAGSYRDVMKDAKEATLIEQESKAVKVGSDIDALISDTLRKIESDPENINYKRALADLYTRAQRYDEAFEVLEKAHEASGGGDPEIDRALTNLKVNQFDGEIETLRAAGKSDDADTKELAKKEFLLETARDRVQRYPNDLSFKYDLGVLLFEQSDLNGAIQQFQASQRNPQRRIRSLYYLALCFKQKEQYDIAIEQLEKAGSELHGMDATKKDIYYELGLLAEAIGDPEKASAYYKEIYAVDIGYKDISTKIEKVYKK